MFCLHHDIIFVLPTQIKQLPYYTCLCPLMHTCVPQYVYSHHEFLYYQWQMRGWGFRRANPCLTRPISKLSTTRKFKSEKIYCFLLYQRPFCPIKDVLDTPLCIIFNNVILEQQENRMQQSRNIKYIN